MDVRPVPGRDLEQHAPRVGLHLRAGAAHQAGDRRRPVGVLDHDDVAVQRTRLAVEGLHLLAVACAAHHEPRAGDAVEVEGVQRLAGQQHRVVGDVDHVVDRALPCGDQTRPQPQRRGRDRDIVEDARGKAAAQVRALDADLRALQRPLRAGIL